MAKGNSEILGLSSNREGLTQYFSRVKPRGVEGRPFLALCYANATPNMNFYHPEWGLLKVLIAVLIALAGSIGVVSCMS